MANSLVEAMERMLDARLPTEGGRGPHRRHEENHREESGDENSGFGHGFDRFGDGHGDMVVVAVLVLIISVVAVVHMDVMYDLKMKSLNTMIMKDLMMMKILLHMAEGLSDVIITDVLILKIGIIIMVIVIEMTQTTLLESN